jgi:hypothetical protein
VIGCALDALYLVLEEIMSFADLFLSTQDADNCAALTTQGARFYLGLPGRCKPEPDLYTVAISAAVAAGLETISIFLQGPYPSGITAPSVFLEQGRKLYFADPATPLVFVEVTLAESITLTALTSGTAVPVAVNPTPGALTTAMIAKVWPVGLLTGAESGDWNLTSGSESTTILKAGLKGKEAITSLMLKIPVSVIITPDDPILWNVFHNTAVTGGYVFVFGTRPGGQYVWGTAQVANYNRPTAKQTVQKASGEFSMQDDWVMPTAYKYLSTAEKGYMTQISRLVGIKTP